MGYHADGKGSHASFVYPQSIIMDGDENLIVGDFESVDPHDIILADDGQDPDGLRNSKRNYIEAPDHRIRKIAPNREVTTLAGGRWGGHQDGWTTIARFCGPTGMALGPLGEIYVADSCNNCIRRISNGEVTTFAGTYNGLGLLDGSASAARFRVPSAVAVGPNGHIYVTDLGNARIREIKPGSSERKGMEAMPLDAFEELIAQSKRDPSLKSVSISEEQKKEANMRVFNSDGTQV